MTNSLQVRTWQVAVPLEAAATTAIHRIDTVHSVLVEMTDGSAVGHGYVSAFRLHQARAVHALVRDLSDLYETADPERPEDSWSAARGRLNFVGRTGIALFALAALDTALWDLRGRRAGLPLGRVLGQRRRRLPVYATGGWLSSPVKELVEEARQFIAQGYGGIKIKVGRDDWRDDLRRLEAVRNAIGSGVALMADANQAWDVPTAVAAGTAFADLELTWLEEPVDADDLDGATRVRDRIDVPVASGETRFGPDDVAALAHGAADVLMPDLAHVGGVTGFVRVTKAAAVAGVEVSSHTFTDICLPLLAAAPTGTWVEHVPGWWDVLFEIPVGPPAEGFLQVPSLPGLGIEFTEHVKHDYAV